MTRLPSVSPAYILRANSEAAKCSKPEDHNFRFDEETPMNNGVFMILQCEKCGIVASGLLKFRKRRG